MSRRQQHFRIKRLEERAVNTVRETVFTWGLTLCVADRRILARGYGNGYDDLSPPEQHRFNELWSVFRNEWRKRIADGKAEPQTANTHGDSNALDAHSVDNADSEDGS